VTSAAVLGIDVGGTSIKGLLLDADGGRLGQWRAPTPRGDTPGERTIEAIIEMVDCARSVARVEAVGLVVPGIVDETSGVVIHSVNLGWREFAIRDAVGRRLGVPVAFAQDVRAGAIAESHSGAAAGHPGPMVFVPIGTGLAAALVIDGTAASVTEWSGEIGQPVIADGPLAGNRVEEIASAGAIARRAGETTALAVAERMRAGDPVAAAVWTDAVEVLADTLVSIIDSLAPEIIVIGGGLAESGDLLFEPLHEALARRAGARVLPLISRAMHGDEAAVIGAADLARAALAGIATDTTP
jgi:glucokinase